MPAQSIKISGARQHNLKNLHVEIPREKLVVITGLSGSGKSSLAFDTLYAEGQRRYVESLSAYARQFLDQMEKPDVDFIEGLSPAIAIEQRSAGANPRSTIATTTEIFDYLRVLFSAVGQPHDPTTGQPIHRQTPQQIVDQILAYPAETRIILLAPLLQNQKGEFRDVIEKVRREGFVRIRIDGEIVELGQPEPIRLKKTERHTIEAVVDRLVVRAGVRTRLADSVETALKWGGNRIVVLKSEERETSNVQRPTSNAHQEEKWETVRYTTDYGNAESNFSLGELTPETFFVQQPSRRVSGLPRLGHTTGVRCGFDGVGSGEVARGRCDYPMAPRHQADAGLLPELAKRARETFRGRRLYSVRGLAGHFQESALLRDGR